MSSHYKSLLLLMVIVFAFLLTQSVRTRPLNAKADTVPAEFLGDKHPLTLSSGPTEALTIDDTIYFLGYQETGTGTNDYSINLWQLEGSPPLATHLSYVGRSGTAIFEQMGNTLVVAALNNNDREQLLLVDLTTNAINDVQLWELYQDIPGATASFFGYTLVNNQIYFGARVTINNVLDRYELWKTDGTPPGTTLLKSSQNLTDFAELNNALLFQALSEDGTSGELWRSDGTVAGTQLIKADIDPIIETDYTLVDNNLLYFIANDGEHGFELWVSNGTSDGTQMLCDIYPGSTSSFSSLEPRFWKMGDTVYFVANDGTHGDEVWITDGTPGGTQLLLDIAPGTASGIANYRKNPYFTEVNSTLHFVANDGTHGAELWQTTGSADTTTLVQDLAEEAASSNPFNLLASEDTLYFTALDAVAGYEWHRLTSDGTLSLVIDSNPGPADMQYVGVKGIWGDQLYFSTYDPYDETILSLWASDGTPPGTHELPILNAANLSGFFFVHPTDDWLLFPMATPAYGTEFWQWDGMSSETSLFIDANEKTDSALPLNLTPYRSGLVFSSDDGVHGRELWQSDGTTDGTQMIKDLYPGAENSSPFSLTVVGETLFFQAYGPDGTGLWQTDGTTDGTSLLKPFDGYGHLTAAGDFLYFIAPDETGQKKLWRTNGTVSNTISLVDAAVRDPYYPSERFLAGVDDLLFFTTNQHELWVSDGTLAGTQNITPVDTNIDTSRLGAHPDALFLTDANGALWTSDGTLAGTIRLSSELPIDSYHHHFQPFGEQMLIGIADELWISNGTVSGTQRLKAFSTSEETARIHALEASIDAAFLILHFNTHRELWKTDGTPEGTLMIKSYPDGSLYPDHLAVVDNLAFFDASSDDAYGVEAYVSNGAPEGTILLHDIAPGSENAYPSQYTFADDGYVYFVADNGQTGRELWRVELAAVQAALLQTNITVAPTQLTITSQTTADYTVSLAAMPTAPVIITLSTSGETATDVASLTFTPNNWETPQTVTVSAVGTSFEERVGTIFHTSQSSDSGYHEMTIADVKVTIQADEHLTGYRLYLPDIMVP